MDSKTLTVAVQASLLAAILVLDGCCTSAGRPASTASAAGAGPGTICPADTGEALTMERAIIWRCQSDGLDQGLLAALGDVAAEYNLQTRGTITITSGRRTLRHQAQLMAAMSQEQLEGMYCRNGYPSYVRDMTVHREAHGELNADDAYLILSNRTEGYISSHLSGAAVDIASDGVEAELLKELLEDHGFRVLDERSLGINCIHATYRAAPTRIVTE